jgi:hypothetical protein
MLEGKVLGMETGLLSEYSEYKIVNGCVRIQICTVSGAESNH